MKIIKSKYSSEELNSAYEQAETKVRHTLLSDIEGLIKLLSIFLTPAGALMLLCGYAYENLLLLILSCILIGLGIILFIDPPMQTVRRIMEKMGYICANQLEHIIVKGWKLKFSDLIEMLEKYELIDKCIEGDPDIYIKYIEDDGYEGIMLIKGDNIETAQVVKSICFDSICEIDIVNENVLDFSIYDQDIEKSLASAGIII